jgi:aryl-alcohol dehydrogenase-like predicted oxidoreductase
MIRSSPAGRCARRVRAGAENPRPDAVSARHSATQAEVALAWVIARPGVTAPISSATTVEQTDSLIRAASLELTAADIKELDKASA